MARLHAALLMLALSSASATEGFEGSDSDRKALAAEVACTSITDQRACCGAIDSRDSLDGFNPTATEKYCVPAKSGTTFTSSNGDHVCEPVCAVNGKGCAAADADQAAKDAWAGSDQTAKIYSCWIQTTVAATTAAATAAPAATEPATTTSTYTPWDSSASSSDSDTLDSSYSSSFKEYQESSKSSAENSWESSGSDASGSGGSYMHLWQWGLILGALAICCCAVCAAMVPKPKPKKPKTPPKPQPKPEPVEEPMPELAPLMPVTTSYVQQPVAYVQQPVTYAQAAPAAYVV